MKRRSSTKKSATVSIEVPIADCLHETLRLPTIKIAERCPSCRLWVRSDGQTFATVNEVMAARSAAIEEARSFIRLAEAMDRLERANKAAADRAEVRGAIRLAESMEKFEQCKSTGE